MAATKECDVCGIQKTAFINNTTKAVSVRGSSLNMFVKVSKSDNIRDICTDCFGDSLLALREALKPIK